MTDSESPPPKAEWIYRLHPVPREESAMVAHAGAGPMPVMYLLKVIDELQREGWDYYDTITTSRVIRPGCIQGLLGVSETYATSAVLLFRRRARAGEEGPQGA